MHFLCGQLVPQFLSKYGAYTKKKHPPKVMLFLGAVDRNCAFSGAPRWTIINCPSWLTSERISKRSSQLVCSRKRLQPSIPVEVRYNTTKKRYRMVSLFCGADEGNKSEPFYRPELSKSHRFLIRLNTELCSRLLGLMSLRTGVLLFYHIYYKINQKTLGGK